MASPMQQPFLGHMCESCGIGTYQEPLSAQEWHLTCNECDTVKMCYVPMTHQASFHADTHKFRMYAGGFGSAKTSTCCMEIIEHIMKTPKGTTLIGAATLPQLENTAQKEFFEMFPQEFIASYSKQKNYLDTINGHRVIFRPLDSEQKARSLNLTAFWIEEANGINFEYFTQLQTRLRNHATKHHIGILSTNPDMNWVKQEFLLKSDSISGGSAEYHVDDENKNPNFSTHIAETSKNTYLPDDYYDSVAQGKPEWWINRYLHGSFENREGLVYPQYVDNIVDDFEIPKHWKKGQGSDFGLQDPTATVWGAIDPATGVLYLYDEHYENQKPVSYHAEEMNKRLKKIPFGVLEYLVGDAKGKSKSENDMRSTFDHYAEYGIYFTPSTKKLEDSIMKMFTYFEHGKIKIFRSLKNTLYEFQNYRYPEKEIGESRKNMELPEDKLNHMMDAIRYLVAELPDDPEELRNESYNANVTIYNRDLQQGHLPHALQDDDDSDVDMWNYY